MSMVRNIRRGEPYDVYIGRAGHGENGYFGNPFKSRHAEINVAQFRKYAEGRVEHDPEYRKAVASLHGKTLGCFCAPGPCHGDVLVELAAELHEEDAANLWAAEVEGAINQYLNPIEEGDDGLDRCQFCGGAKFDDDPMLSECTCVMDRQTFLEGVFSAMKAAGAKEIQLPTRDKIVLGTGGRTFGVPPKDVTTVEEVIKARREKKALFAVLDEENPDIIIEGGANGADRRFREWGEAHGKDVWTYPAPWEEFKAAGDPNWKRAGTERNWKMADVLATEREKGHDCLVIACPGGTGTQSMKDISNLFEFYIREVEV